MLILLHFSYQLFRTRILEDKRSLIKQNIISNHHYPTLPNSKGNTCVDLACVLKRASLNLRAELNLCNTVASNGTPLLLRKNKTVLKKKCCIFFPSILLTPLHIPQPNVILHTLVCADTTSPPSWPSCSASWHHCLQTCVLIHAGWTKEQNLLPARVWG